MTSPGDGDGQGDLWRALANPWRRQLLDLLRDRPKTTGELATAIPQLSRFAVMQHLDVLTDAKVVLVRRHGRYRVNHLNPVPLRRFYERWVHPLADTTAAGLLALDRAVHAQRPAAEPPEGSLMRDTDELRFVRLTCEMTFRTSAETLFDTMTHNTQAWFPHTYGADRVHEIVLEPRIGGRHYEDWGDGAGHLYGQVTVYDPPRAWATRGRVMAGSLLDTEYTITDHGDGTVTLDVTKVAVGPMTEDEANGIRTYGDLSRFEAAIRAIVE